MMEFVFFSTQTPSGMDSLREELKEKDTLITSMSEQLKSLQVAILYAHKMFQNLKCGHFV